MNPTLFLDNLTKFIPKYANVRHFNNLEIYNNNNLINILIANTVYISWNKLICSLNELWQQFILDNPDDTSYHVFIDNLTEGLKSEHLLVSQLPYKTMNFKIHKLKDCYHAVFIDDFSASGEHLAEHIGTALSNFEVYNTSRYYPVKKISIICPYISKEAKECILDGLDFIDIKFYTMFEIFRWTNYISKQDRDKLFFNETACCVVCDHSIPENIATLSDLYNKIWPMPDNSYKKLKININL